MTKNLIARLFKRAIRKEIADMETEEIFSASNTDFYHTTTGQVLFKMARDGWRATGNMYLRGGHRNTYTIIGGLSYIIPLLADFRFDDEFIDWTRSITYPDGVTPRFTNEYLEYLRGQPFNCLVEVMRDGDFVFPGGPIGRITGDVIQVKWVDSIISDFLRRGCSVATKATRMVWASQGKVILADNSMRRSNDTGGLMTADLTYMCGFQGSSNMRAAMESNYPAMGTVDHWTIKTLMAEYFWLNPTVDTDKDGQRLAQQHAFRRIIECFPRNFSLLIDTIDIDTGVEDAIVVFKEFKAKGMMPQGYGLRLDSGNLAEKSKYAMDRLQQEGLVSELARAEGKPEVYVLLSGGLRAVTVWSMLTLQGAEFLGAGIGGYLQNGREKAEHGESQIEPDVNVEIVTKVGHLVAPDGQIFTATKISSTPEKASHPGILDRLRFVDSDGMFMGDVEAIKGTEGKIESVRIGFPETRIFPADTARIPTIIPMVDGPRVVDENLFDLEENRAFHAERFAILPEKYKPVDTNHSDVPAGVEKDLYFSSLQRAMSKEVIARAGMAA